MLEKTTEAWLKKQIEKLGGYFLKWTSPGTDGVPDRILLLNGHVMFVEMKQADGRLSPRQSVMLKELARRGAMCHVVYGKEGAELFYGALALMTARGGDPFIAWGYRIHNWKAKAQPDSSTETETKDEKGSVK